jgi:RimJ/RimL family protein N-acetyltransferase
MVDYYVRPGDPLDTEAISTLILAQSPLGVGTEGTQEELERWWTVNAEQSVVRQRFFDPNTLVLVAESPKSIGLLGTSYVTMLDKRRAVLGGLYCAVRGQGVGSSLVREGVEWLTSKGIVLVETHIARQNVAMNALAISLGFDMESEYVDDLFPSGRWGRWFLCP